MDTTEGTVIVLAPGRQLSTNETEKGRALFAAQGLSYLIATVKQTVDLATWRQLGGMEVEALAVALERGGNHPLLQEWRRRRRTNRPAPGLDDLLTRRTVARMSIALQRTGMGKREARAKVAEELARAKLPFAPSAKTVEHWELTASRSLTAEDEAAIAAAIARGPDRRQVAAFFVGLLHLALNPAAVVGRDPPS